QRHADWFLRCGTTTVESKSGYGLTLEDELKILRVMKRLSQETLLEIVPTFLGAHAVPRKMHADEYVDLVVDEMLPRVTSGNLAAGLSLCARFDALSASAPNGRSWSQRCDRD